MAEKLTKVDEYLKRIHFLEESKRTAGEALRNAKAIVRKFEECCNEYGDAYEEPKDSKTQKNFTESALPVPVSIPEACRSCDSLVPREALHEKEESLGKHQSLLDPIPEHVGTQINAPLSPVGSPKVELPQKSPSTQLPAVQEQQAVWPSVAEVTSEVNVNAPVNITSNENQVLLQTARPVPELIHLNCTQIQMSTCQELKAPIGNNALQVGRPIQIYSTSTAKPVQQIKPSMENIIPNGVFWGRALFTNTGKSPGKLAQHVSNASPPAAKKLRVEPIAVKPKRKDNLCLVMKSCPVKPAILKVEEWLRALDPKFGTMGKWLLSDTESDGEDAENVLPKRERANRSMQENYPNNALDENEKKRMMCHFCNNRLSLTRCPKSLCIPGKKVTCHLCARELFQISYHRHMKAVHGNNVKTQCDLCKVILPFTIIGKHMSIVHPNVSSDDKSVGIGTVLQDEEMYDPKD